MAYTEEMTTSEILLRLASMRNELLQAVNDIEKISNNICYKAKQTEPQTDGYISGEDFMKIFNEPQTMYYPQVDGITPSVIVKDKPQTSGTPYKIETSSVCKDEPKTVSLTSAHISGDIYHKVKAEL